MVSTADDRFWLTTYVAEGTECMVTREYGHRQPEECHREAYHVSNTFTGAPWACRLAEMLVMPTSAQETGAPIFHDFSLNTDVLGSKIMVAGSYTVNIALERASGRRRSQGLWPSWASGVELRCAC